MLSMIGMYIVHVHEEYLVYVEFDGYVQYIIHVVYLVYAEYDGYVQYIVHVVYLVHEEDDGYVLCTSTIPSICKGWWVCSMYMYNT